MFGYLRELGHDVRVMIPEYSIIDYRDYVLINVMKDIVVPKVNDDNTITVKDVTVDTGVRHYLIGNNRFFQSGDVYGEHEIERFFFLLQSRYCRARSYRLETRYRSLS